jgi:homoserine/homoserine lactone efflux protein
VRHRNRFIVNIAEFSALSLLPILSPGPSTILVVRNALARGWTFAAGWVLVDVLGTIVTAVLLLGSLGAWVAHSRVLTAAIQLAGTAYVLYYGFACLKHADSRAAPAEPAAPARGRAGRRWAGTLLTGLLNPKTLVFFSFLSQTLLAGATPLGQPEWFYPGCYALLKAAALWVLAWATIRVRSHAGDGASMLPGVLGCALVGLGSYLFFHVTSRFVVGSV